MIEAQIYENADGYGRSCQYDEQKSEYQQDILFQQRPQGGKRIFLYIREAPAQRAAEGLFVQDKCMKYKDRHDAEYYTGRKYQDIDSIVDAVFPDDIHDILGYHEL